MKITKIASFIFIITLLLITLLSGCGIKTSLFDVCDDEVKKWVKSYNSSFPEVLTVYVEHEGITQLPQTITSAKITHEVFDALALMRVIGKPEKGPIDFTVSPDTVIYHFRAEDGSAVSFTFMNGRFVLGDPIKKNSVLYTCSDTSGLFGIDGIDLSVFDVLETELDSDCTELDSSSQTTEYSVFSNEKQDFSFLYDSNYYAEWSDEYGAMVYTESKGFIPYLSVYRNIAIVSFNGNEYFENLTDWMDTEYGHSLLDIEEFQTYMVSGKEMQGVLYTYIVDDNTIQMLALIELTEDSAIQYTCQYIEGQGEQTLNVLSDAVESYQPAANYYNGEGQQNQAQKKTTNMNLVKYDGDYFTVMLPEGWQIQTMGQYTTFGFRAWDPQNPDYEIFYFGNLGPLLKSEAARQWNENIAQYTQDGGEYHMYADSPVIDVYDAGSIFYQFDSLRALAEKYSGIYIQPGFSIPSLYNFMSIDTMPLQTVYASTCTNEALVFASIQAESGRNCYGKFSASILNAQSYYVDNIDLMPTAALNVTGVIAPQTEFANVEQILSEAVFSLTFTEEYLEKASDAIRETGETALADNAARQAIYDKYNEAWDSYIR